MNRVATSDMVLRVVKLGGSLLSKPRLAEHLEQWLSHQPPAVSLVLVGGGPPVDSIRHLAAVHEYDQEFLHWLCIDLLDVSYRLVAAQLPDWSSVRTADELRRLLEPGVRSRAASLTAIVSVAAFYDRESEPALPVRLPRSWDTTSDSLAALLAQLVGADELVLLKSCAVPMPEPQSSQDWHDLARDGIVDRAFPRCIEGLKQVRCANL